MPAYRPLFISALTLLASLSSAHAANITWSNPANITGDSDVITTGSLTLTLNLGNTGVASTTVNTVPFSAFPVADGTNSAATAAFSIKAFNTDLLSTALSTGSASTPFSSLSTNYKTLLSSGVIKPSFLQLMDMQVFGLTVGHTYTVQIWMNDSSGTAGAFNVSRLYSDFNGNFSPNVDDNTTDALGGTGQYILGTFTADAANEFISAHGSISPTAADGALVNALQVRDTSSAPEPASLALLAIAPFLLSRRRK